MRNDQQPQKSSDSATRCPQRSIACDCVGACVSVIPLRVDGSKAPSVQSWNEYRDRFASADELRQWFARPPLSNLCRATFTLAAGP